MLLLYEDPTRITGAYILYRLPVIPSLPHQQGNGHHSRIADPLRREIITETPVTY